MSQDIPAHLVSEVAEFRRGGLDGDPDRKMRLFADLAAAHAVPHWMSTEVATAIEDGWISPAGDVLRYDGE